MPQQQQTQRSIFSSSIGQYTQQQQTVPGVRIDLSNIRPTTRFNDLHETLQREIETIDNLILQQIHFHDECEQVMPKVVAASSHIPRDVEYCQGQLEAMQHALESDAGAIDDAKRLVKMDAADAKMCFKAIQNLRMPQQFHHAGLWSPPTGSAGPALGEENGESGDLIAYFSGQADEMARKLEAYKKNSAEIEAYLKDIEANTTQQMQRLQFTRGRDGGERSADDRIRELVAVLREFEKAILTVASKVGSLRDQTQQAMLSSGLGRRA
jgi:nucleoporin p58/p45